MTRRGAVYINPSPLYRLPDDGSMVDPESGEFMATWEDDDGVVDEKSFVGADGAIAWALERSDVVSVRLGRRGDTVFAVSEGDTADYDDHPLLSWPPAGPPPRGWWTPPPVPTVEDIAAIREAHASGRIDDEIAVDEALRQLSLLPEEAAEDVRRALDDLMQSLLPALMRRSRFAGEADLYLRDDR